LFAGESVLELSNASRDALVRLTPLLEERGRLGLIRRCHGDLHLGNIALIGGLPVLFDAIEFAPMIATGDVMYDLAFLLMDLVDRRLPEAANRVLNGYLAHTRRMEDLDALALMPLFLSMRASIRAKVTAARLRTADRGKREDIMRSAISYFALARSVLHPPAPQLIAIGGLSGTGKSLLARNLAAYVLPSPGAVVLRSDVERKALFGKRETEKLPPEAYDIEVTARVYASLIEKATRVAAAGHSVLVDAVYAEAPQRAAIARAAQNLNVGFRGLFLAAPLEARIARVGARLGDASDADAYIARRQEAYDLGQLNWQVIDASGTEMQTLTAARRIMDNTAANTDS
jgi:predicted kinase